MCLQTFHGVEKTPLFYYNNQHQEKRFGGSKKGIRFSKKFFETHRKPHGYWVPVISVTKDRLSPNAIRVRTLFFCLNENARVDSDIFFVAKTQTCGEQNAHRRFSFIQTSCPRQGDFFVLPLHC